VADVKLPRQRSANANRLALGLGEGVSVLDAALAYRRLGFAVLPLLPCEKRPHTRLIKATCGSSSWKVLGERPASDDEIRVWYQRDPEANLGIITGAASNGLVVADFDRQRPQRLIATPVVQTGRGLHVYLRSGEEIRSRSENGCELKAEARYVVAPPSIHPSGQRYQWLIGPIGLGHLAVPEADLAPLASWQLVAPLAEKCRQAPTNLSLLDVPTGVPTEVPTRFNGKELGFLEAFDADPEAVAAMCRALGIPYWDGKPFRCLLHEENQPSASVFPLADGTYHYHDWHAKPEWSTFAQVRAALAGRPGAKGSELATWKLILLAEASVLPARPLIATPVPVDASDHARLVYGRFLFVLGCRWNYTYGDPMPLSERFGAAITQLSPSQVWWASHELKRLGRLIPVGTTSNGRQQTDLLLPHGVIDLDAPPTAPEHPRSVRPRLKSNQ
jgi:Bifunctional DNA primase/polymerase, N-terminal